MSEALKKYFIVLERLSKTTARKDRQVLLRIFSKDADFIKALREVCNNAVHGKLKLTNKDKNRLKKHKDIILLLSSKKTSVKRKLIQNGSGFLSVILPLVASVVGSLLNGTLRKNAPDKQGE